MDCSILQGLDHIGIPCKDLNRSTQFYQRLGFSLVMKKRDEQGGVNVAFMSLGSCVIEIYQCDKPECKNGAVDHFAIVVSDIDVLFDNVLDAGIEITTKGIEFLPFWAHGIKFFKIHGPDMESIEFVQRL